MTEILLNHLDVVPRPEAVDGVGMAQIVESKFSHGFQSCCTRRLHYESTGLTDFLFYDYPL